MTDELRKNIEALGPEAYSSMSYYERWISAIANTLLERGQKKNWLAREHFFRAAASSMPA